MKQKSGWFGKNRKTEENQDPVCIEEQAVSPLQEELDRIEAVEKLAAPAKKKAYWHILHPLVQSACVYAIGWDREKELPITNSDARQVFHHWGYAISPYAEGKATNVQKQLMNKYEDSREELWKQYQEAEKRFEQIDRESEAEQEKAWNAYMEHLDTLLPPLQKLVCYELARRGRAQGHQGLNARFSPFRMYSWADYQDPELGNMEGVAFRIEEGCFFGRQATLFYYDDDNWPGNREAQKYLQLIRRYSSGISNVRLERWTEDGRQRNAVVFQLDPSAVKPSMELGGYPVSTEKTGYYMFVLPRCGEFYCKLGEIRDGERIILHTDDYCMK